MAGRYGFSSSASTSMIVTNTPSQDLALTNLAFCNPTDIQKFAIPGFKDLFLALVGDSFVFSLAALESIRSGHIALNSIQRRCAKVSTAESLSVSRFVPPENFNLALLTLELDFIKRGNRSEQVMTAGQKVLFEYHGNNYNFTVNPAAVEGQEKSNSLEGGMISNDTYIIFETSRDSGIKVVNQREAASSNLFKHKEFNLQSLGIGGLSEEFGDIFRRAFASLCFPSPYDI